MNVPKIDQGSFWLPHQGSTLAPAVDAAWDVVMYVSVAFFLLIVVAMCIFVYRYRRRGPNDKTSNISHNAKLEIAWTAIPMLILLVLFFIGLSGYVNASVAPGDAYEINVTAEKWLWTFSYPNGTVSPSKLVVPRGRPVRLVMSSKDVLHSFFIPEFRIKHDVIPGTYTTLWFEALEAKDTVLLCTEYCGTGHSDMMATVSVVEEAQFQEFLETGGDDKNTPPAELGKSLYTTWGCATCHSVNGTRQQGPSFKGLFGKTETLADGSSVHVDEAYLKESILVSNAKVVSGYQPIMPVFQGVLKERQVDALVAFIKSQQ